MDSGELSRSSTTLPSPSAERPLANVRIAVLGWVGSSRQVKRRVAAQPEESGRESTDGG